MSLQVLWQIELGLWGEVNRAHSCIVKEGLNQTPRCITHFWTIFLICWLSECFWYESVLALCKWVASSTPKWMRRKGSIKSLKLGLPWQIRFTVWVETGNVHCWLIIDINYKLASSIFDVNLFYTNYSSMCQFCKAGMHVGIYNV